jgi:serine/threonine-protein kinase ULK/ATG1
MSEKQKEEFLTNVNLDKEEFVIKIADFGFSKRLKLKNELIKTICGTPLYMAPQVVQKTAYSYKADVWSIGVILFELLNG